MVHFISFLSTMTARTPDSNLGGKKSKNNLIAPAIFFFTIVQKPFKANYDLDEIAEPLPQEGKAD